MDTENEVLGTRNRFVAFTRRILSMLLAVLAKPFRLLGWKRSIVLTVIALCLAGAWYFYDRYERLANDPQIKAQLEAAKLLSDLSAIIELPQGELPSIATVSDTSKLAADPFFEKAQNGDVLIVYAQTARAFLFRPSAKKLINVGAFVQNSSAPEAFNDTPTADAADTDNEANEAQKTTTEE